MILKWAQNSSKTRISAAAYQPGFGCFGQQCLFIAMMVAGALGNNLLQNSGFGMLAKVAVILQ
jgi:hypothetical protein